MNLSMSMIARYLKAYELQPFIQEDKAAIHGVRLFTDQLSEYSPEYIYIGQAANYIQDPQYKDAILLVSGKDQLICKNAEYETLLNDVLRALEFYSHYEQGLRMAAAEHRALEEIFSIAAAVITDPVMVMDIDGKFIGGLHTDHLLAENRSEFNHTEGVEDPGELWGINTISQQFIDREGHISHDLAEYPQYLYIAGHPESGCVNLYLTQDGERTGFMMIFPDDASSISYDLALAQGLADACALSMEFTAAVSPSRSSHSIMLSLLQSDSVAPQVVTKLRERLQLSSYPVLAVYHSQTVRNYTYWKMLQSRIEASSLPCLCCEYEGNIFILTDDLHLEGLLKYVSEQVNANTYTMGISMPVSDLSLLHMAYEQCCFTLQMSADPGTVYCKDYALSYLMQNLREQKMTVNLLHPGIAMLQQYDRTNGTDLLQTLHAYLTCRCNQAETASLLHIHLNTLKYRLRRVEELTGISLKDSRETFYVQLSLVLAGATGDGL